MLAFGQWLVTNSNIFHFFQQRVVSQVAVTLNFEAIRASLVSTLRHHSSRQLTAQIADKEAM